MEHFANWPWKKSIMWGGGLEWGTAPSFILPKWQICIAYPELFLNKFLKGKKFNFEMRIYDLFRNRPWNIYDFLPVISFVGMFFSIIIFSVLITDILMALLCQVTFYIRSESNKLFNHFSTCRFFFPRHAIMKQFCEVSLFIRYDVKHPRILREKAIWDSMLYV